VEFNESGSRLAAVTNASNCYQWDFESRTGHSWELAGGSEAKFGPSAAVLIATSVSGGLALLREDSGDTLAYVAAHPGREIVLAVDAGSRRAVTGGADSLLKVWSLSDLRPLVVIPAGFAIRTLAFSPDRLRLFGAGDEGRIQAWDTRSWALTDSLSAGPSTIVGLAVHPDGVRLATCSLEGAVTRWNLEDRNPSETILQDTAAAYCATLSPDGLRLAVGTGGQLIRIFDFDTKRHLVALHGHTGRISALAWSPDGRSLASAAHDGRVRVWDAPIESP
jgi:WD40 repeat protein